MAKFSILYLTLSLVLALLSMCSARDTLRAGETLRSGFELRSLNGHYSLRMQKDCNLVLYRGNGSSNPIWSINKGGSSRNCSLTLQTDGNLVVYGDGRRVIWASGTNGSGTNTLIVQNDGNAVLYRPVWATNTGRVEFKLSGSASTSGNASDDPGDVLELPH